MNLSAEGGEAWREFEFGMGNLNSEWGMRNSERGMRKGWDETEILKLKWSNGIFNPPKAFLLKYVICGNTLNFRDK
jgi:hypothetical protein